MASISRRVRIHPELVKKGALIVILLSVVVIIIIIIILYSAYGVQSVQTILIDKKN